MRKESTSQSWTSGFLVDETWHFSKGDRKRITKSLGVRGRLKNSVINDVESAAQLYRSEVHNEAKRPPPSESKGRLLALANQCSALAHSLDTLDDSALEYLEEAHMEVAQRNRHLVSLHELTRAPKRLWEAAACFQPQGRPRQEALGVFVNLLALIWERVHGTWPKRSYSPWKAKETGAFRDFVTTCLRTVNPHASAPDYIIRRTLEGRRLMDKKGLCPK
jgi:hypothetical protein